MTDILNYSPVYLMCKDDAYLFSLSNKGLLLGSDKCPICGHQFTLDDEIVGDELDARRQLFYTYEEQNEMTRFIFSGS